MTNSINLNSNKNQKIKKGIFIDTNTYRLIDKGDELVEISLCYILSSNEKLNELRSTRDFYKELHQILVYLDDNEPDDYFSMDNGYGIDYKIIEKLYPGITSRIYPQIEISKYSYCMLESSTSNLNESILIPFSYDTICDEYEFARWVSYDDIISTLYHFKYINRKSMLYFKSNPNKITKKSLDVLQDALSEYLTNFHNYIKVIVEYIDSWLSK